MSQKITKIVQLQDLEPVRKSYETYRLDTKKSWKQSFCKCWNLGKECTCKILYYEENCESNVYQHKNAVYGAFVEAYNNHKDIILSPDDIMILVNLEFSKYITKYSEEMRNLFVDHQGKKELTITTWNERSETEWDEFFSLIGDAISDNTKDHVVKALKVNFSTTTRIEKVISTAVIMDCFKHYFSYARCIPACGIRAVRFMGTLDDWINLKTKILVLKKYAVDDYWSTYIERLEPILEEFINTYKERVNLDFWNKIMNMESGRLGSGSCTKVSGWILHLFGIYNKINDDDIPAYKADIPVKIDNRITNTTKNVKVLCGFSGVNEMDDALRPQLSIAIMYNPDSSENKQKNTISVSAQTYDSLSNAGTILYID